MHKVIKMKPNLYWLGFLFKKEIINFLPNKKAGGIILELEKRIINWLVIGLFIMIDFFLIPITIYKLFPNEWKAIFGEVDVLAFIGAIIGGLFTWYGVKLTLRNQYKRDFLNTYAERKKLGDDVSHVFVQTINKLDFNLDNSNYAVIHDTLSKFLENKEVLLNNAAKVSGEGYEFARYFINTAEHWNIHITDVVEGWKKHQIKPVNRQMQLEYFEAMCTYNLEYSKELKKIFIEYKNLIGLKK